LWNWEWNSPLFSRAFPRQHIFSQVVERCCSWPVTIVFYTITLRIHAISLVEGHDLLEDRRTELRHKFLKCRKYLKNPLNLYKLNEFIQLNI
jgi:hypothetical protein